MPRSIRFAKDMQNAANTGALFVARIRALRDETFGDADLYYTINFTKLQYQNQNLYLSATHCYGLFALSGQNY